MTTAPDPEEGFAQLAAREKAKGDAIRAAYLARTYTDRHSRTWKRGLDGWFHHGPEHTELARADELTAVIAAEWELIHPRLHDREEHR